MKKIVEIIKKSDNKDIIGIFDLKQETTYKNMDIFLNPNRDSWNRLSSNNSKIIKEDDYRKVIAFSLNSLPALTLNNSDQSFLNKCLKDGYNFLEIECHEDGYPNLKNGNLIIYDKLISPKVTFTPTEALQRIKEFNEQYTNNHKLTPGLHESS